MSAADIPVFITYRDRAKFLRTTFASLVERGFTDITVVDNGSIHPLTSLHQDGVSAKITRADNTYRQLAPWYLGLVPEDRHYIVMDSDIELDCPDDVGEYLTHILAAYDNLDRIGLGIRTDDFLDPAPERYAYSYAQERAVAKRWTIQESAGPPIRMAPIDTHFALYRAGRKMWPGIGGARTVEPYLCRHLPWYEADYTADEETYYQGVGRTWATTHCAGSLAPIKVVTGFTNLRARTIKRLTEEENDRNADLVLRPLEEDTDYWQLLGEHWGEREGFLVVEQDIVIAPGVIEELKACPSDWCASPYPYLGSPKAYGLGITKFHDRLISRHPDLFRGVYMAGSGDDKHPPGHWCMLDYLIWHQLTLRGEMRCQKHHIISEHIDSDRSAHGCQEKEKLGA